jgi:hypothetical protein
MFRSVLVPNEDVRLILSEGPRGDINTAYGMINGVANVLPVPLIPVVGELFGL